jgi:acyl carrier protein
MDDLRGRVLSLISTRWTNRHDDPLPPIGDADNLFDLGVVDSLMMMEVVALVEDQCRTTIDFLTVDPEIFFTLAGIAELERELTTGSTS